MLLLGLLAVRRRPCWPAPGERLAVFLLGAVGYAIESTFFFLALDRGTAAAVALLFYAYPAIVTLVELATGTARPSARLVGAIALSRRRGRSWSWPSGDDHITGGGGARPGAASALASPLYFLASHRFVRGTGRR